MKGVRVKVISAKLEGYLAGEAARMGSVFSEWQRQGADLSEQVLRRNTPVRSGFLRGSIVKNLTPVGFTVYPTASYAEIVEKGSKPHTIFPVNKKVLRWSGATFGDNVIFARKVEHPGFPGRFFIRKSRDELREKLRELYSLIWKRAHNE